ncbi:MAG: hypothetical protein J2P29_00635 [Actinobacteria bacterium]|nr:hypothetical protein [Actinomycetota bacterium]
MDALILRPTTAQLRSLLLTTCVSGIVAVLLLREHLAGHDASDRFLGWGIIATAVMLLMAGVTVAYSRAFTECTEAGIRFRGLGLERRLRWDQVSQVGIRIGNRGITRTVMLTLTGGAQDLLAAPVTGGLMQDREFDRKVREIYQFWRRATGMDLLDTPIPVLPPTSYRATARSTLVGLVTLVALGLMAALPVMAREDVQALLVHLGQGQPGYFTGYFHSCSESCGWVGDFTASDGSARRNGVTMAPGATITPIDRVPAVSTGSAGPVYPAGGGTGWIPLAITLAVLAVCLVVEALWVTSRIRQRRAERQSELLHDPLSGAFAPRRPARTVLAQRRDQALRTITVSATCLVVAGAAAAVLLLPIASPTSRVAVPACADYGEWLASYYSTSLPWADQAALARARQVASSGALGLDLTQLDSDVTTAAQLGQSSAGQAALAHMTIEMQAVGHDCFG